jgi:Tfp pilus assembly protein PilX
MNKIKSIVAFVAAACGIAFNRNMANESGVPDTSKLDMTHKDMLWKLLGLAPDANPDMVNEMFKKAMAVEPDDDDKKKAEELKAKEDEVKAANERGMAAVAKVTEVEAAMANEKAAKEAAEAKLKQAEADLATAKQTIGSVETQFTNERAARTKLELDAAVVNNKITGAQRKDFEAEFANTKDYDATLKKLGESKGTKLPATRQAANIGARKPNFTPEDKQRRDRVAEMVNEESKKACYRHLKEGALYSAAFSAVIASNPELQQTTTK